MMYRIDLYNAHVTCLEYTEDMMYRIDLYNVHVTCLEYTEDMMYRKETELTAGLGVAIGLMGIEMVSLV